MSAAVLIVFIACLYVFLYIKVTGEANLQFSESHFKISLEQFLSAL